MLFLYLLRWPCGFCIFFYWCGVSHIDSVYFKPSLWPCDESNLMVVYDLFFFFWRRQWHPTPVLLPGKSYGRRSLVSYSPWGRKELDTTEWLPFHFSLSCIGEGNGNPLQCSCLENPRDGGAWWAAIYGVAQSRTQLKQLSSMIFFMCCWIQFANILLKFLHLYLPKILAEIFFFGSVFV